jgi:putative GTP pyrophosphokinase
MQVTPHFSNSQIDRLGRNLRTGPVTDANIRFLDAYRRSFVSSYQYVISEIRTNLGLEPTGRPAKSTRAIAEKLRRETIRLSQIQDIAGCRIVVADSQAQENALASLSRLFPEANIVDRRETPSYGYRAVHLIPRIEACPIEIQLRTALQHLWAELSEKLADITVPEVKYGGGSDEIRSLLAQLSEAIVGAEMLEARLRLLDLDAGSRAKLEAKLISIRTVLRDSTETLVAQLDDQD